MTVPYVTPHAHRALHVPASNSCLIWQWVSTSMDQASGLKRALSSVFRVSAIAGDSFIRDDLERALPFSWTIPLVATLTS